MDIKKQKTQLNSVINNNRDNPLTFYVTLKKVTMPGAPVNCSRKKEKLPSAFLISFFSLQSCFAKAFATTQLKLFLLFYIILINLYSYNAMFSIFFLIYSNVSAIWGIAVVLVYRFFNKKAYYSMLFPSCVE